ncbi:hypothetical protein CN931_14545 [Bacillus sp. AFS054943]|uniref:Uncharacterized protein n=1 Tax=Bacillus cereus TaxID=1396 RepID=A0A2C1LMA7_BACCE|nr:MULTISPECIES: hypothetical protein [Bacillus]PGL82618.1 hypothetical protein CN931_14545 [Bacillus sp. AFS054943]PGT99403.1 hypothetical protein COD19_18940 [Bacillus cereus]
MLQKYWFLVIILSIDFFALPMRVTMIVSKLTMDKISGLDFHKKFEILVIYYFIVCTSLTGARQRFLLFGATQKTDRIQKIY